MASGHVNRTQRPDTWLHEREAFWAAVYKFKSPEWSPAFLDQPAFEVKGKYFTIRQVCELVKDITPPCVRN
jgi:hypothetical protein